MNAMAKRQRPTVGALVVAAILAAAAGVGLGWIAAPEQPRQPTSSAVSVGPARVLVPRDWQATSLRRTDFASLDGLQAVAFETTPGLGEWAVILFSRTAEPSLIPAELRADLRGPLPAPADARLAGSAAWSYRGLATARPYVRADATVLPTTTGVLAVVCTSGLTLSDNKLCAADVESVSVKGATPVLPSPSLALQRALPAVLTELNRARLRDRATLSAARTPTEQALAAGRLAVDHRASARAIRAAGGPAATPLARDLTAVADGYDRLRKHAQSRSRDGFAAARAALEDAEAALQADVRAVPQPVPESVRRTAVERASGPRSGAAPVVFWLLIALAVAAGGAAGSSGAASRLWQRVRGGGRLALVRAWNVRR